MTQLSGEVPMTWCYVDVAAARIQTWLARTPKLRFHRGASTMLAIQTSLATWGSRATAQDRADQVEWNSEAGEISGIVALRFPAEGLSEPELRARAQRLAWGAAWEIQSTLPGCAVGSSWGVGTTYLAAYADDMRRRRARGDVLVDLPPRPDESIVSRPCARCGTRAVNHPRVAVMDDFLDLCEDCWSRVSVAGYQSSKAPARLPDSQSKLFTALVDRLPGTADLARFPDDFATLAGWGRVAVDDAPTQLALIYADGDRVGAALKILIAAQEASPGAVTLSKRILAEVIDAATKAAIVDAADGAFRRWSTVPEAPPRPDVGTDARYPVVVHVAGGDDVLVSVPAAAGWLFAWLLTDSFRRRVTTGLSAALAELGLAADDPARDILARPATMSAGVVFHHAAEPFSDVVVRAAERLKAAKSLGAGNGPALAYLDITADGEKPVGERAWRLAGPSDADAFVLTDAADTIAKLAKTVPAAHRARLIAHLRDTASGAELDLRDTVRRLGRDEVYAACRWRPEHQGETPADTLDRLVADPMTRSRLRAVLDAARWWPPDLDAVGIRATEDFLRGAIDEFSTKKVMTS